ncbi:SMP-30/gluconolactonase/LRE family protein [Tropicimonas sp. S265A]|uniref:SMP-30/gluconolactonase/LRE family protein n=1 Tax=Tropicimonas sp. S265A TaxID=3415134 RepID=UPI003C7B67A6
MSINPNYLGRNLRRAECVLTTASGDLFCSGFDRGVTHICPDGRQFHLADPTMREGVPTLANGIALLPDGRFLVANIADGGGLMVLDPSGLRLFHDCALNGTSPPVNFVLHDHLGKTWITVSSTFSPRSLAYNTHTANGYVAVIENGRMRVVAEGLAYTNEVRADYEAGWLYIAETMGQRISRIRLDERGLHGAPQVFAQMPRGAFVDGIEIDSEGHVLAACIVSSEIIRIDPEGGQTVIASERIADWVDSVEAAFAAGEMGRAQLDHSPTKTLRNLSSIAFRGADLTEIVCGNLLDDKLPVLPLPVAGRAPPHWRVDVPIWGTPF